MSKAMGGEPDSNIIRAPSRIAMPEGFGGGSVFDRLPDAAQAKLTSLRDRADEARDLAWSATERMLALGREKQQAESDLRKVSDPEVAARYGNQVPQDDHPDFVILKAKVERLTKELNRASETADARNFRGQEFGGLIADIDGWLEALPEDAALDAHSGAPAKLGKSETIAAAVERVRQQRLELLADLHSVRSAPVPSSVVKEKIRAEITALAERARPDTWPAVAHGEPVKWPTRPLDAKVSGVAIAAGASGPLPQLQADVRGNTVDALGLLLWFAGDEIAEALERQVDELSDDTAALSDEQRAAKEQDILARVLDTERTEESFIELGEQQGVEILRRREADVRAVLGLSSDLPARRNI